MTIVEHHSAEELQRLFRQEKDARVAQRIWIAWQARRGRTEPQITKAIGLSRRSVRARCLFAARRRLSEVHGRPVGQADVPVGGL